METDYEHLPRTIDALGNAQTRRVDAEARQTDAWLRMMGAEEELTEARAAYRNLQTTLTMRYADAHHDWARAKNDAEAAKLLEDAAAFKLNEMLR